LGCAESIHFLWDTERYLWEKHYALLVKVQRDKKNPDDPTAFRRWVTKQRDAYHEGTLTSERVELLNEVNFHWGEPPSSAATAANAVATSGAPVDDSPDASAASGSGGGKPAASLSSHHQHHHHDDEEDDDDHHQQSAASSSAEARQLAASLAAWDVQYKALVKYKREHGHLNVSHDQRKYAALASWCRDMRTLHRRKELGNDKKKKLKDLGFRWANRKTGPKASWEERFAQLKELLRQHQGMEGLLHYAAAAESLRSKADDPSLLETIVSWVDYQRVLRKHHKLDQDKIDRLTAVGLVWDAHQAAWDARYKQLVAYTEHGIKPRDYSSYVKWEHRQRREYRLGTLNHDRIQRLNSIGFRWEPRPTRRRASNQSHTSRHSATSSDGGVGGGGGRAAFGVGDDAAPRLMVGSGGVGSSRDAADPDRALDEPNPSYEGSHSVSSFDDSRRGGVSRPRRRRRPSYDDDDGVDDDEDGSGSGHTDEYEGRRRAVQQPAAKRMRPSPTSSLDDYGDDAGYGRGRGRGRGRRIGPDEAGLKSGTSAEDYEDEEEDDHDGDHDEDDAGADASASQFYPQDYSAYAAGH
jgi:Helicase associated domain